MRQQSTRHAPFFSVTKKWQKWEKWRNFALRHKIWPHRRASASWFCVEALASPVAPRQPPPIAAPLPPPAKWKL